MIYTERVINVKNGTATIDQPIVLFRGDRNIEIVFEIVNSKFKFSEKGNYILDIGAKYGQLAVDMPDGTDLFTEIAECMDGKVIFKITGDMINEIAENGFYSFHVRLFNEDKTSRVTIPPIMEGIEIREPIVIEGDGIFPIVDMGTADVAVIDSDKESFIDENGNLNIEWKNGDIISSTKLNQIVEYINDMEDKVISEDNLANYATLEHVNEEFFTINSELNTLDGVMANTQQMAMNAEEKATEARDIINSRYDQLDERLQNQQDTLERFEVKVDNAEANAAAAFEGVKDRAYVSYVDQKDSELLAEINELQNGLADYATIEYVDGEIDIIEDRIQALEQAEAPDLSGYATTEYVDRGIGTLNDRIDSLDNEISNAGLNLLREDLESVRAIAEEGMTEEKRAEFKSEIMASVETDFIHPQNEAIQAHDERIQALEEAGGVDLSEYITKKDANEHFSTISSSMSTLSGVANNNMRRIDALEETIDNLPEGSEAPDLTGYATTEYVDGQISEIQTAIEILPDDPENPSESECITKQYAHDSFVDQTLYNTLKSTVDGIAEYIPYDYDPEDPGLYECITTGYASSMYLKIGVYSAFQNVLNRKFDEVWAKINLIDTGQNTNTADIQALQTAIGGINDILDAINGEEI